MMHRVHLEILAQWAQQLRRLSGQNEALMFLHRVSATEEADLINDIPGRCSIRRGLTQELKVNRAVDKEPWSGCTL